MLQFPHFISRVSLVTALVGGMHFTAPQAWSQAKAEPITDTPPATPAATPAEAPETPAPAGTTPPAAPKSAATNPISEKQLADLLKALKDLNAQLDTAKSKATGTALTAIQAAMTNDDKAYSLFMDCKKQVDFDDKGKTGSEWGEWKRRDDVKALNDPEHTTVLKLQLQWLALSIQAGNATTETAFGAIVAQVPTYLDALGTAWKRMKTYRGELNRDVLTTVFGQYFKLDQIIQRREGWSYNPLNIDSIYDQVVLPHLRKQKNGLSLANSWKNRIQMLTDALEIEELEARKNPNSRAEERSITFKEEKLPRLNWGMMKDGFLFGNETSAAVNMLSHIRSNLGHKDAELWIAELEKLANHEEVPPTIVGDSSSGQAPEQRQQQRGGGMMRR